MALPDFYSQWTQARQNGAQRANDQTVRQNIGGALQGDSGALSAILKASPQTGMQVQQYAQGQRKAQQEDAGKVASMFAQTGDPQYYAMWKQSLAGIPNAPQLPDALTPDDIEPAKQSAMAFAQAYGGVAGTPAGVQEFRYMTQGLKGDDVTRARRIALGLDPRSSSAAIQYKEVVGSDGKTRIVALDPREVGSQVIGDSSAYGSGVPSPQQGGDPFASLRAAVPGLRVTSTTRTPEENARLPNSVPNSFHLTGQAIDIGTPSPEQQQRILQWAAQNNHEVIRNYKDGHWHLEPRGGAPRQAQGGVNPYVSQAPNEKTYAEESGRQGAQLDALPDRGRIEAENAALKAQAEQTAKTQVEVAAKLQQRSRDDNETLKLLSEAETILPSATGSGAGAATDFVASNLGISTPGAQATAKLNIVAAKLVGKVPRFEGPQSNIDVQLYREAAGDLANPRKTVGERLAALRTMRALIEQNSQQAPQQPAASQSGGWSIKVKP